MQSFGAALQQYLKTNNLRVEDAAKKFKTTPQNIYNWVNGRNMPSYCSLLIVGEATKGALAPGMFSRPAKKKK